MKVVRSSEMRELDRKTIEEHGVPGAVLMDRAGLGVANEAERLAALAGYSAPLVRLIAGRGNNGGDAFVAARYLKKKGFEVELWLTGKLEQVKGDAVHHLNATVKAGIVPQEMPEPGHWVKATAERRAADILVDGILGTGVSGPARDPAACAIRYINEHSKEALVLAVDVPSGLNADTGLAPGETVLADVTVTMGLPKLGLVQPAALDYVGSVEVVDIGIPPALVESVRTDRELITATDLMPLFARRPRAAHKGSFGRILLVCGSHDYPGAAALAAKAAVRSGAGLVTVLVPKGIAPVISSFVPEAIVRPGQETETGSLSMKVWPVWRPRLPEFDAILFGPGMTPHEHTRKLVVQAIRECHMPLVLDADAVNVLETQPTRIHRATCAVVATPHPGELARLLGVDAKTIQSDRMFSAMRAAEETDATVVLKGAGTIVAEPDRIPCVNMTGNPGMATGGMGDVLAGLTVGLLGQEFKPFDAARASVFLHGRAGDNVWFRTSQAGLIATDIIEELPYAFRDLTLR
ncbi:MAG: NAD(P)H-hydrate dehydratase [Kiritimatiellae bacterium]|nr:NAD(P)H-hydrate dehydratase [Kiritimatiellia bacterium]